MGPIKDVDEGENGGGWGINAGDADAEITRRRSKKKVKKLRGAG